MCQPHVIIYTLCENLNTVSKDHLCAIFNTVKHIISNYLTVLQNIAINECFYVIFKNKHHKSLITSNLK